MDRDIRTVLLVDASASMLFYLGMLLKRLQYQVETAKSVDEALAAMTQRPPSVVVSDVVLQQLDGPVLLQRMKESGLLSTVPVVLLSSENDPAVKETCLGLGCAAYLQKPVDPELLYRTVQKVSESVPRSHIRLGTSLKVIVGDGTTIGGAARTESATALSEGGMYVQTKYPQPRNTVTPVQLFLPKRTIRAKAIVLYSKAAAEDRSEEAGMGMRFVELSDEDRNAIRDFIREQVTHGIHQKK